MEGRPAPLPIRNSDVITNLYNLVTVPLGFSNHQRACLWQFWQFWQQACCLDLISPRWPRYPNTCRRRITRTCTPEWSFRLASVPLVLAGGLCSLVSVWTVSLCPNVIITSFRLFIITLHPSSWMERLERTCLAAWAQIRLAQSLLRWPVSSEMSGTESDRRSFSCFCQSTS